MKIGFIKVLTSWREVLNAARNTVGKDEINKEPKSEWKRRMLLAEHSPIRSLILRWKWADIPYWVHVHLVRHKIGIEHFITTSRSDRTGIQRDELPQGAPVDHECIANAQAIINISRKRLCNQASPETREAWMAFLESFKHIEPELYYSCVPDCIYRGYCYELKSCGLYKTEIFEKRLKLYREGVGE
jgi:hypothetical protein